MKLKELPNIDPKSFEWAAFKWLVKRFARPSRRLCIGSMPPSKFVVITINDEYVESAPNILILAQRVQESGLK